MKTLCEGVVDINYHQANVAMWLKCTTALTGSVLLSWPSPASVIGERAQACNHLLPSNTHALSPNYSVEIEWSPYNGNNYSSTKEAVIWRRRAEAWRKTSGFSLRTAEIVPQPTVWVLSAVLVLFSGMINKILRVLCTVEKYRTTGLSDEQMVEQRVVLFPQRCVQPQIHNTRQPLFKRRKQKQTFVKIIVRRTETPFFVVLPATQLLRWNWVSSSCVWWLCA